MWPVSGRLELHVIELHSLSTICCYLLVIKLHLYFLLRQVIQLLFGSFFTVLYLVYKLQFWPITWNIFFIKKRRIWYKFYFTFLWIKEWNRSWHAKPTLPVIGLPSQRFNASQSGRVFLPRKAVLIWHTHVLDCPRCAPEHASPTIFEYVLVGYRCIYRHDLRVHVFVPKS